MEHINKIELVLTHPPSINSYLLNGRKGAYKYLSAKAKIFLKETEQILKDNNLINLKLTDRLKYSCYYYAPDKRKRDIDNFCNKVPLDALKKCGLFVDDEQIDIIYCERKEIDVNKKGYIKILIEKI
jgi:Holliday junction resolvase RusA-like endonuclease